MPGINYNIQSQLNKQPIRYKFITDTPVTDQAYYANTQVGDYSASYNIIDWALDAAHTIYRGVQQGEMNESEDMMATSKNNINNANKILQLYDYLSDAGKEQSTKYTEDLLDEETKQQFEQSGAEALQNLRLSGAWTQQGNPSYDDLQEIIKKEQKKYNEEYQNYLHNLDQYNSDMKAYDISQYFTRKSNQTVTSFGNLFFKLPATMGTSQTSPFLQSSSLIAQMAGVKAGASAGAYAGSFAGPVGTAIGSIAGAVLGGTAAGQLLGGKQSREYESHMEAFNAQLEKLYKLAEQRNIDLNKVSENVRNQLQQKGIDTSYMDQRMLIEAALSQGLDTTGSYEFDQAAEDVFKGSRRVYEINNALGFGEVVSNLTYALPLGRWFVNTLKGPFKLLTKPLTKGKIGDFLEKRFQAGVEVSKMGTLLRNKVLKDKLVDFAGSTAIRSIEEASEEGTQSIIADEYLRGEYDDDYANATFTDALSDGQVFQDLAGNIARRFRSVGSFLNLDAEYKSDQQMFEEMLFGAIMPFTNPTGVILGARNVVNAFNMISNSKKVGDHIASTLALQDEINRNTEFYKLLRQSNVSGQNYEELLDNVSQLLKSKSVKGNSKFKLDTTALTEDGKELTDEDIDKFTEQQKKQYKYLSGVKKASKKQLKELGLENKEDEDLFLALKAAYLTDASNAEQFSKQSIATLAFNSIKLSKLEEFEEHVKNNTTERIKTALQKLDKTNKDKLISLLAELALLNEAKTRALNVMHQQSQESIIKQAYAKLKLITDPAIEDNANSISSYIEANKDIETLIQNSIDSIFKTLKDSGIEGEVSEDVERIQLSLLDGNIQINDEQKLDMRNTLTKSVNMFADSQAIVKHTKQKQKEINGNDKNYINSVLKRYRDAQKKQAALADENNAAAREKRDPSVSNVVKEDSKVTDMTAETVEQNRQAYKQQIKETVSTFKQLIENIPDDSVLSFIKQRIKRGEGIINDDDMSYARFVRELMRKLYDDYEKQIAKEKQNDEDKKTYEQLKKVANNIDTQINKIIEYNAESEARAKRFSLQLDSNPTVWFDENGNRYTFDTSDFEYSENEGVIVKMQRVADEQDEVLKKTIKRLENDLQQLKKEESYNIEDTEKLFQLFQTENNLQKVIDSLKDKLTNTDKVITNQDDPFLQTLTSKNNLGDEIKFSDLLESYKKKAQIKIDSNKQKRKVKQEWELDGDVYEFDINNGRVLRKNSPAYRQQQIEDSPGRTVLVKAYPLNSTFGAKQASKLTNPFHAAKFWRGFITMPYSDSEQAKKYFKTDKEDYGKVSRFGKTWNRYKAIDTFNKIGKQIAYVLEHDKVTQNDLYELLESLAKGEKEEIKIGIAKLSKDDYDNIIYALPLITNMYQQHTGKQVTVLNLADFVSLNRTTKPNQAEIDSRVELINNLLLSFKERGEQEVDVQEEGFNLDTAEKSFSNRVYFDNDSVQLVYGDFDYNTRSEMNESLQIYKDEEGNYMGPEQMKSFYESKAQQALENSEEYIDELVDLLNSPEMGFSVTKEMLQNDGSGKSKLFDLLMSVAKYGDGVTDLHGTFIPKISQILEGIKNQQKGIKNPNLNRAKKLLFFFQDRTPDIFLSNKNTQDQEKRTPIVRLLVKEALSKRWFDGKNSIRIKTKDGQWLDYTNTEENVNSLTSIFEKFEKAIRESRNAEEFMQSITNDYDFFIGVDQKSQKNAEQILREYFYNRRFSRLKNATNIVQALTMCSPTPANSEVNYENFNRKSVHVQDRIDKVPSLGLVKDENGRYYFSLEQWQKNHVKKESQEPNQKTEYQERQDQIIKEHDDLVEQINKVKTKEQILQFIISHKNSIDDETYKSLVTINKKDGTDKLVPKKLSLAKSILLEHLEQAKDNKLNDLEQSYTKEIKEEISKSEELQGYTTLPLTFAFGSYDTDDGAAIIRFDRSGNKVRMQYANGTPGAMYLVLPSFLTAARTQIPIKLNPKRFDDPTANFIASLLRYIQNNNINLQDFVNTLELDGFKVQTTMSFQSLLDNLIYVGTDAYANNPSDHNLERLLYIDKSGKVVFGEQTLSDDNFDQLVDFIKTKKTFRVDRMKAGNPNATFSSALSIQTTKDSQFGESTILDVAEGTNYISFIVDNGILLTDLSQSKTSNLVTKPSVYIKYRKNRQYSTVVNDPNSSNSAAAGKGKLKQTYEEASREEIEEMLSNDVNDAAKKISVFFKDIFDKIANEYSSGNIKFTNLKIGIYGHKSNKLNKDSYSGTIYSSDEGLHFSIDDSDKNEELKLKIIKAAAAGKDISIVVMDEAGNFLQVGGKKFHHIPSIKLQDKKNITAGTSSATETQLNKVLDAIAQLIDRIGGTAPASPQNQSATQTAPKEASNTVVPSGYVGLNAGKKKVTVVEEAKNSADIVEKEDGKFEFIVNGESTEFDSSMSEDDVLDILDEKYEGAIPSDVEESFKQLYQSKVVKSPESETRETPKGTLGKFTPPTPISKVESKKHAAKETDPLSSLQIPATYEELKQSLSKDPQSRKLFEVIDELVKEGKTAKEYTIPLKTLYTKYVKKQYPRLSDRQIMEYLDSEENRKLIRIVSISIQSPSANLSSVFDFLSKHVQKEDFDAALSRAEKILGKHFDLTFLTSIDKRYDLPRQAMVYVFGQCASSGIRIFRDASTNKIARGSLYHESFHKISLFILSEEERNRMYSDARQQYPEIRTSTDKQVEEFLADRFAEFVLDSESQRQDKYYEGNLISRFFQKLFDNIRSIINRLTKFNITPEYVDMNKLFRDMYSGRYAYAKATSKNIELFEKVYSGFTPFAGFKVDDVEIAEDAQQYQNILRDLVARFIRLTDLLYIKDGKISFNSDTLKQELQSDLDTYNKALNDLKRNRKTLDKFSSRDVDEALVTMYTLMQTYQRILQDDVWAKWTEILTNFVETQFNIQKSDDPQDISDDVIPGDNTEDMENSDEGEVVSTGSELQSHMSNKRDSYMTDMFSASHPSMKLLLWSISQFDPNDPNSGKFTPEGLIRYANVRKVYRDAVQAISGSRNVQDMLEKLKIAADKNVKDYDDYGLIQLYSILSDESVPQAIRNRFFSDFVRNVNAFDNHVYESEDVSVGKSENGKDVKEPRYTASVRSGNTDAITEKLSSQWKANLTAKLGSLSDKTSKELREIYNKLLPIVTSAGDNINKIMDALRAINNAYGFGVSEDIMDDALVIQKLKKKGTDVLKNIVTPFSSLRKENIDKFADQLFSEKGILTQMSELLSSGKKSTPKTDSIRGPKGNKIYSISAYNFITRLFDSRVKDKEWRNRMRKNPYCQHSVLLKAILNSDENVAKVRIKLGTVLDGNYGDSIADIGVTKLEDLLNRFVSVLSGRHLIPSLANKRFAADISGLETFEDLFDTSNNINQKMIDRFVGYLADEILAISDAMYVRNNFINELNKILLSNYTVESFSNLTPTQQEEIFKNNLEASQLLGKLVQQYHYTSSKEEYVIDEKNNRIAKRVFHIDLTKGTGYKFRHFKSLQDKIKLTDNQIEDMSKDVFTENSRDGSSQLAYQIARKYTGTVTKMLNQNILATIDRFIELGIIYGNRPNIENGSVDIKSISNRFLPQNLLLNWNGKLNNKKRTATSDDIYKSIGYFTLIGMSDVIEFEKIVSGDIGFHKNITSVNKRYSGITSTIQITSEKGTIQNEFDTEDRLYDSPTFNTVTFNTTEVVGIQKFKDDMKNVLGADVIGDMDLESIIQLLDPKAKRNLNTSELIKDGKFTSVAEKSPLISRYIQNKRVVNGVTLTDQQLLDLAIDDAINRFKGFLTNDPTDASVFITAEMYRALRQREGNWNDVDEACYNLLENYDKIYQLSNTQEQALRKMCNDLNISYSKLIKLAKKYNEALQYTDAQERQKVIDEYKGFIYSATEQLQATSLKYVYYGEPANRADKLYVPTYDKMSLSPIFKIFAEGHEMIQLYDFMKQNKVDMVKINSAVKSGGVPSFELFDKHGRFDTKAMQASIVQQQYFELIGKQLNTDAHEMHSTALLTQFMKIAMMNIQDGDVYNVNGTQVKGSVMKQVYNKILNHFTTKGLNRFREEFGIEENGINKVKLMRKLQKMALTQGLPADTINSFKVIGDSFVIHPAGIPNMRWIQSRLLSEMGKKVIDTLAPGQALYQVASAGYDNIFNIKQHPDKHLLMPGENGSKRMQVKLSILFFKDIIDQANREGLKLDTFDKQRQFILQNQELFALSYRVPTQGQNSTLPIEIVDVFPPQRGAIISFPAGITALTGSDFDIDKMFLARPNYTIKNGKLYKVQYNMAKIIASSDISKFKDEELQNALLDMYQAILTSKEHYLASNTPLDVCTAPVKDFINKEVRTQKQSTGFNFESIDGYYSNPIFQTDQKLKNAASDGGIGPMALNSVFRFFIQQSGLSVRPSEILKQLGLDNMDRIYDNSGEDILDLTSALINAFVDAVKDSYIGDANVNGYTYDVTSFLITSGFGHDTFAFLTQPALVQLANTYNLYKNGKVGVTQDQKRGQEFLNEVMQSWISKNDNKVTNELASPEELSREYMMRSSTRNNPEMQLKYINTFLFFKDLAQGYRDAIRCAQIDTKKYGINVDELISFIQAKQQFTSEYNLTFSNPDVLFDETFLGDKYTKGLEQLFTTFENVLLEFSPLYKNTADELSKQYSKYGRYSKRFLKVVGPKIKAVIFSKFFNEYIVNRFGGSKPLYSLLIGANSVPERYSKIKEKCMRTGEGYALFEVLKPWSRQKNVPGFFTVDRIVNDDAFVRSNVQAAISEMFNSDDNEIREWITDFTAYMFYLTGANDSNAGGLIKTTIYDLIPPQHLANIKAGNITFNQFIEDTLSSPNKMLTQGEMDLVMRLVALTDDDVIKSYDPRYDSKSIYARFINTSGNNKERSIVVFKKGSYRFYNSDRDQYDKFIKVWNPERSRYDIYQLGNIVESTDKTGKVWANPVYFKIDSLGYRNSSRASFSVRTDGYVDQAGNIVSLMNNSNSSRITNINDLSEKDKINVLRSLGNPKVYQLDEYHSDDVYSDIYNSDVVFYVNDSQTNQKSNQYRYYAEFLGKEYHIISDINEDIPNVGSKKYTIISPTMSLFRGEPSVFNNPIVQKIIDANSLEQLVYSSNSQVITQSSATIKDSLLGGLTEEQQQQVQQQKNRQDKQCKG